MYKGRVFQFAVLGAVAFIAGVGMRFLGLSVSREIASPLAVIEEHSDETRTAEAERVSRATPSALPEGRGEIEAPSNIVVPRDFNPFEDFFLIVGRAEPNSIVNVSLTKQGEKPVKFSVNADGNGEWEAYEKIYLSPGEWEVRARAELGDKVSSWSNPRVVRSIKAGIDLFGLRIRYVPLAAVLLGFLFFVASIVFYFLHRIWKLKRGLFEKQIRETEVRLREHFAELRRDLMDELRVLAENAANRPLTAEELQRREHILRELDGIERQMSQEMIELEKRY